MIIPITTMTDMPLTLYTDSGHLNALLDDLVLLAKIEAGTLRLQPEPIALRTVIEQAIDQL